MTVSVGTVMRHCRNYFEKGYIDGTFRITGNALSADTEGARFVYISGSMMHDGVWEISNGYLVGRDVSGLDNEEFDGRVWLLAPPVDFLETVRAMQEYEQKNPLSAVIRESFGGYSKETASINGVPLSAENAFSAQLTPYRKMFTEVR